MTIVGVALKTKTYWKGSDLRVRLLSGMKSWYLSLHELLSDCPDGFLPIEWVRLWPSTPSTSTRNDDVDLRSKSSGLFQLDRRDPPRRTEVSLPTVRCCCCCCCCVGFRRNDSSRDIFTSCRSSTPLSHSQRRALLLCDSDGRICPHTKRDQQVARHSRRTYKMYDMLMLYWLARKTSSIFTLDYRYNLSSAFEFWKNKVTLSIRNHSVLYEQMFSKRLFGVRVWRKYA